jgi:hypothetical protein
MVIMATMIRICYSLLLLICLLVACKEKRKHHVAKIANTIKTDTTLKWVDYNIGELPPIGQYDAFDSIIKKWNIRYQRIEGGCNATPAQKSSYENQNPKYFKVLESRFGKNWRTRFDEEVEALQNKYKSK